MEKYDWTQDEGFKKFAKNFGNATRIMASMDGAVEFYREFKRFANIFHILANKMDAYAGDLFIDFPSAWDMYLDRLSEDARYPIMLIAKTHADELSRYEACLREEGKTFELWDCVRKCQETLGADFMVEITPYKVIVTNFKAEGYIIRDLESRLKDYSNEVEIVDGSDWETRE